MGGGPKQFGVDAERVPAMLARSGSSTDFPGLPHFSGSQNLGPTRSRRRRRNMELAAKAREHAPSPVRLLNIAGAFGIPYFVGERELDSPSARTSPLMDGARDAVAGARGDRARPLSGGEAVSMSARHRPQISRVQVFLITDGDCIIICGVGNFGQVIRKNYPSRSQPVVGNKREVASVVGPLCTRWICSRRHGAGRSPGRDLIAVFQSGAYA